ncbi:DUF72 domain-containing protein [Flavobacterium aquidurense]|uniref:DUF72 domain-containing protein n=1 Tax=Flavobacterium aquidurense TaxID=362413 RepID=UPI002860F06A|nr:DUF72 domain-containing protein [Flavobacterium aquidurense]MDR7370393.1 uncharacterized protein YecE (DUF72 family) [Flavobacterium aquidurense]
MKNDIQIGCSSFNNRFWNGIFYPDNLSASKWFEFYCQHFSTYEFNGSFYRFPTVKVFENWYNKSPEDFIFSVKAPKEITHIRKFLNCEDLISAFYEICKLGFKDKLGAILFQFPPSYKYSPENLDLIIQSLNPDFKNVIEFRHESWWIPEVWNALSANNITFCSVSHPQLPQTILTNSPFVYIRFHGIPKLFYSGYSTEQLLDIKAAINSKSGFVYFNNTASEAGILNALEFNRLN